jgi:ATP phosphoribosyltransferase
MTITLALSKGRIFEETLPLLKAAGIEVLEDPEKSRKLIIGTTRPRVSHFMNKFRKLGFIKYNGYLQVHSSLLTVLLQE